MESSIASAVMLPEQQEPEYALRSSPTAGQKRRRSSVSEADSKRPRQDNADMDGDLNRRTSVGSKAAPVTSLRRERGRERRLFGAALGALSQNPATAAQKKRTEIEKRQRDRQEREEQESDQRKREREIKRRAQRRTEQDRFERESMRVRHASLLNSSHFLQTVAEPPLYYKPWETTPVENDIIQEQITNAKETIRLELEEYEMQQERASKSEGLVRSDTDASANPSGKELHAVPRHEVPPANGATDSSRLSTKRPVANDMHAEVRGNEAVSAEYAPSTLSELQVAPTAQAMPADPGFSRDLGMDETTEEVVEAAEDTVIY